MNTLLKTTPEELAELMNSDESGRMGRIMVVDDDADTRRLIVEALVQSGYQVDAAENGTRAWTAFHLKPYDLLVTDHQMPGMTGLQLVHKLRSAGFGLPVIFASGSFPLDLLAKNAWLTCAAMLPKPFTLGELIQTVSDIVPGPGSDFDAASAQFFSEPWQQGSPKN